MTSGEEVQNQVFFDDVRVPKANVIGEIDDGWTVAKYLLEFERGGGAAAPALQVMAERVATAAAEQPGPDGGPLIDDPAFAAQARRRPDPHRRAGDPGVPRPGGAGRRAGNPGPASSMLKILATELSQTLTELALEAAGPRGRVYQPHATAPGRPDHRIRTARRTATSAASSGRRSRRCATSTTGPARSTPAATRFSATSSPKRHWGSRWTSALTKEQELLRDGLTKFLATRYDLASSRTAAKTGAGWQPEIWRAFADELGILGATLPEEVGGIGGGPVELMVIAEALGYALVVEPFVDTVVLGGGLLHRAGGDARDDACSSRSSPGPAVVALAATEPTSGDDWHDVATTARRDGDELGARRRQDRGRPARRSPPTCWSPPAPPATARPDGISLFLVDFDPRAAAGVERARATAPSTTGAPPTWCSTVCGCPPTRCSAPRAGAGRHGQGARRGRRGGRAPRLSAACARCSPTPSNTRKQRQQFGQPIGSFQALQHRMVDMYMEVEQSVAAVYLAVLNLDADAGDRARAVSAAKATIGRAARFVGQNAVQLHGGMGMTEELAIGHYFKRLTAIEYEFGSTDHHVPRYARPDPAS